MALTTIKTTSLPDDAITSAKIADDAIITALIADDAVDQARIADEAIDEARIQISNAGSNGQYLSKQSGNTGGLTWATVSAGVTSDGQNNTIAGTNAGDSFTGTDAVSNTLIGYDSGTAITTGDNNIALGYNSGQGNQTADHNISIGYTLLTINHFLFFNKNVSKYNKYA